MRWDQHACPADWEGRTMLALTMHAQNTKREPAFFDAILERLPDRINKKGYIGPVYPDGVTHEQAMADHFLLRWKKVFHGVKKAYPFLLNGECL